MSVATTDRLRWDTAHEHFAAHVKTMPRWHKAVLVMGVVLALAGGAGGGMGRNGDDGQARVTSTGSPGPAGSSKFINYSGGSGGRSLLDDSRVTPSSITPLRPHAPR